MHPDRPSSTADLVAAWRALEASLPEGERLLDDALAREFVGRRRGRWVDAVAALPPWLRVRVARGADAALAGVIRFVVARHRAIDDEVLRGGWAQVVILGAGYDTRALRLREALRGVRVFEVDHPATAARKQARSAPTDVVRVAVDFEAEAWRPALEQAGFATDQQTLWVWEGVSMYLDEAAVRATLRDAADCSGAGSELVCDLWCPPGGRARRRAARRLLGWGMQRLYGEPFRWAPTPDAARAVFAEAGWAVRVLLDAPGLLARYGARAGIVRSGMTWVRAAREGP